MNSTMARVLGKSESFRCAAKRQRLYGSQTPRVLPPERLSLPNVRLAGAEDTRKGFPEEEKSR